MTINVTHMFVVGFDEIYSVFGTDPHTMVNGYYNANKIMWEVEAHMYRPLTFPSNRVCLLPFFEMGRRFFLLFFPSKDNGQIWN